MGSIGAHHGHPYALQAAAFVATLLFPGGLLVLLAGALREKALRRSGRLLPSSEI